MYRHSRIVFLAVALALFAGCASVRRDAPPAGASFHLVEAPGHPVTKSAKLGVASVIAVGGMLGGQMQWWRPDGSLLASSPIESKPSLGNVPADEDDGMKTRRVLVTWDSVSAADLGFRGVAYADSESSGSYFQGTQVFTNPGSALRLFVYTMTIPDETDSADLLYSAPDGTSRTETRSTLEAIGAKDPTGGGQYVVLPSDGRGANVIAVVNGRPAQVTVVGRSGKTYAGTQIGRSLGQKNPASLWEFPSGALANIHDFQFVYQNFERVEFDGVAMDPVFQQPNRAVAQLSDHFN